MILETSYRRLFAFIPREVLNAKQLACDPLPPLTTVNLYDGEFFKGTEDVFAIRPRTRRDAGGDQRMLERLIPDPVFRRQLQVCYLYSVAVYIQAEIVRYNRHFSMQILASHRGSLEGLFNSLRWRVNCLRMHLKIS
jgi:hypothetical protein